MKRSIPLWCLAVAALTACEEESTPEPAEMFDVLKEREAFYPASLPAEPGPAEMPRRFEPQDRCYAAWHRTVPSVTVGDLAPWADEQTSREVLPSLTLELISNHEQWDPGEYGGVMRGFSWQMDLSSATALEFWVNDFTGDGQDPQTPREGVLHVDFGFINEDFWWPRTEDGGFTQFTFENEDRDGNYLLNLDEMGRSEDTGLDGIPSSEELGPLWPQRPGRPGDPAGDDFDVTEHEGFLQFPYINGGENNRRLDSEDLDLNGHGDHMDGYFTFSVDLADPDLPLVDIHRDFAAFPEFLAEASAKSAAWRKYSLPLAQVEVREAIRGDGYLARAPDRARIPHLRLWYENPEGSLRSPQVKLVLTRLRFVPREEQVPKNPLAVSPPRAGE